MASVTDELYRSVEVGPAGDARDTLERSIRAFLETFVRHRRLWRSVLEASFTNRDVETLWLSLRARFVERLERDLRMLVDAGAIRVLDTPLGANALGGMVEWAATTQLVLESPPTAHRSLDDTVAALTDLWWAAVFADAPA